MPELDTQADFAPAAQQILVIQALIAKCLDDFDRPAKQTDDRLCHQNQCFTQAGSSVAYFAELPPIKRFSKVTQLKALMGQLLYTE